MTLENPRTSQHYGTILRGLRGALNCAEIKKCMWNIFLFHCAEIKKMYVKIFFYSLCRIFYFSFINEKDILTFLTEINISFISILHPGREA